MSNKSNPHHSTGSGKRAMAADKEGQRVVFDLEDVIDAELAEIVKRRQEAGLLPELHDLETAKEKIKSKLVGMSLSGGGIRSASFCLGVIQTFYKTGLLRHVDYISAVSGGAYAAASLASDVINPATTLDWKEPKLPGKKQPQARSENGHATTTTPSEPEANRPQGQASAASLDPKESDKEKQSHSPVDHVNQNTRHKRNEKSHTPNSRDELAKRLLGPAPTAHLELGELDHGKQPKRIVDLVNRGSYLREPRPFLNRWLIGVVLIGIVTASGLTAAASFAAFLFRSLDSEPAIRLINTLGFKGDIYRAFFPCAIAFAAWMIAWSISYWRRGERATGDVAQWLLLLTAVLFLMAMAALLGTGDINTSYLRDLFGLSDDNKNLSWISGYLKLILPGIIGFSLLPYLTPLELIRSGTRPKNALESWIFAIASRALLYGVPLILFGWLAQENISSFNEQRYLKKYGALIPTVNDIVRADFPDWEDAWNRFELETSNPLSEKLWDLAINRRNDVAFFDPPPLVPLSLGPLFLKETEEDSIKPNFNPIERCRKVWAKEVELEKKLGFQERWLLALGYLITGESNDFITIIRLDKYFFQLQTYICKRLTHEIIENPRLYDAIEKLPSPSIPKTRQEERVWTQTLKSLGREGIQIANIMSDSGVKDWNQWNNKRLELRKEIDTDPYYQNEESFWYSFRFWNRKSEDLLRKEKELRDHVLQEDGKMIRYKQLLVELNWKILKTVFPDRFSDKSTIFAKNVQPEDQKARLSWCGWSLVIFLLAGSIVNMNSCSLHGFYKERLASMWIEPCPGMGTIIPLAQLETTSKGAPYHLFGGTVNAIKLGSATAKAPDDVFLFGQAFCGSERTGFIPTKDFARGTYDLASAVSISGAALSPAYFQNPLLWTLMLITNLRLGQWLPNPAHTRSGRFRSTSESWGPVPLRLMLGMLNTAIASIVPQKEGSEKPHNPFYCYVTDGGYIENLGLEQLLLRRCKVVIVCDVSCDPTPDFGALMDVIRRVRTEQGIHIHRHPSTHGIEKKDAREFDTENHEDLGLQDLCSLWPKEGHLPGQSANEPLFSREHVILASIHYPAKDSIAKDEASEHSRQANGDLPSADDNAHDSEGVLIYIKPTLTGDEDADLILYRAEHPEFPHDSTMDQFYTPAKFESYRQLGAHSGRQVIKRLAELSDPEKRDLLGPLGPETVNSWAKIYYPKTTTGQAAGKRQHESNNQEATTEIIKV